jgi:hypothetical protein
MITSDARLVILKVVELSAGRWDTRSLDFEYYSRCDVLLKPNILAVLRDLERGGFVESVVIEGGTGPGWRLTGAGRELLGRRDGHGPSEDTL